VIGKLVDFVVGREPVATATGIAGGVAAAIGVAAAFDLWRPTAEQTAAVVALVTWIAGYMARRRVSPAPVAERPDPRPIDPYDTVEGDSRIGPDAGGVPLAVILLVLGIFAVLAISFASCDALIDDEEEPGDLGMASLVVGQVPVDNEPCRGDGACQGRQKRGCAEASAPCSDDDNVVVVICVHPDSCRFDSAPAPAGA
jgi:hypothetical protein